MMAQAAMKRASRGGYGIAMFFLFHLSSSEQIGRGSYYFINILGASSQRFGIRWQSKVATVAILLR
jgi:hypothetical protein